MAGRKLRYVVLLNHPRLVKRWQVRALEELEQSGLAEPVLIIVKEESVQNSGFLSRAARYLSLLFTYRFWEKFLWRFHSTVNVPLPGFLTDVEAIHVQPILKGRYSEYFGNDALAFVRAKRPDFILRFGFGILKGEILDAADYGVWSYHHSDPMMFRGGPPVFWEIFRNKPYVGAVLQRLTERIDGGIILKDGKFPVIRHAYRENLDRVYYGSTHWIKQACLDLHNGRLSAFQSAPCNSTAIMNRVPGRFTSLIFLCKLIFNKVAFYYGELFRHEFWAIGISREKIGRFREDDFLTGELKARIVNPSGHHYYADPFVIQEQDDLWLFVEDYSYKNGKAGLRRLSVPVDASQPANLPEVLMEDRSHRSFPFVFRHEADTFLLPENHLSGKTLLYRLQGERPEPYAVLLKERGAIDPVLFFHEETWWLFCTHAESGSSLNLFLYFSGSLREEFTPHPCNPVKTDITSSRPAGRMFVRDGCIYRPAQDCARSYGHLIRINEVVELSRTGFAERPVAELHSPLKSHNAGMHTIDHTDDFVVFDAKKYGFSWYRMKGFLREKLFGR